MASEYDTLIVGGGLAGLRCAKQLAAEGLNFLLLEASDQVGGRVRTDSVDGFLLDRGFQVFLTAYPECQDELDYDRLELRSFRPGALVRCDGKFHRLADPWRQPHHALATALSPAATLADKMRIARFRTDVRRGSLADLARRPSQSTLKALRQRGFSQKALRRFFLPFFGGIFLESALDTSSRVADFVFRMFAQGDASLPERGMQQIPEQLAEALPSGAIRNGCRVSGIETSPDTKIVRLESGETLSARSMVVATQEPVAQKLIGSLAPMKPPRGTCRVTNLYFAADSSPVDEPTLVLNGEGPEAGPINNLAVPSLVSRAYAPAGQSLVSVSVLDNTADEAVVLQGVLGQLREWFGSQVGSWRHLKTYSIQYALPSQLPSELDPVAQPAKIGDGFYLAGDHCDTASINGAFASGRRAAEAVLADLRG